jgi:hypothetical protein
MSNELKIFNVTNRADSLLEDLYCEPAGVGKDNFPKNYLECKSGDNIYHKDPYYAEYVFQYWFWKNSLKDYNKNAWLGFCQYRRYWLREGFNKNIQITRENLKDNILNTIPSSWKNHNAVIAKRIYVHNAKFTKLIKKGFRNYIKDPSILYDNKKHTVKLHFDMFHGYGILDKAIDLLNKNDRENFREYVNKNLFFNPHNMFISHPKIMNEWFKSVFEWLFKCEEKFGFKILTGYEKRLYGYLAERYLSFWFNKYTNPIEWDWAFVDMNEGKRTNI